MLQIPSRLPRECRKIPSPDRRKRYKGVVNAVLRYNNVLHLHQHVCHEIGDTMVRTSRFALLKIFLPATHLTIWSFARRPQFFVVGRTVTNLSLPFTSIQHVLFRSNSPLCLLQNFSVGLPLTSLNVLRQAICNLISRIDPPQVSFTRHCLSLDYGQLSCRSLVC